MSLLKATAAAALALACSSPLGAAETKGRVTLRGQVVCSTCWFEADRTKVAYGTAADLKCAAECAAKDIPAALAVNESGDTTLYVLDGKPAAGGDQGWLPWVAKQAEVSGVVTSDGPKKVLHVERSRLVATDEGTPAGAAAGRTAGAAPATGPAPDLVLEDLAGAKQRLAQYQGKVVVLNFWATWCLPCKHEMPILVDLQASHGARGVQVVGAAGDGRDAAPRIEKLARELKINFPLWLGANAGDMKLFGLGDVVPGTALIDRAGRIVWQKEGMIEAKELRERVEALLGGK